MPKTTRKFPTEQKTTNPEGRLEYQKLQMREQREKQKEQKISTNAEKVAHNNLLEKRISDKDYSILHVAAERAIEKTKSLLKFISKTEQENHNADLRFMEHLFDLEVFFESLKTILESSLSDLEKLEKIKRLHTAGTEEFNAAIQKTDQQLKDYEANYQAIREALKKGDKVE